MAAEFQVRLRDGTELGDIAGIASNKSLTRTLNRPASCSFRVPSYMVREVQSDGRPLLCAGYRQISVELDSTGLFFHGIVWNIEEDGDEDMVYSQVTCYDPMILWRYRPARDDVDSYTGEAGNLSDPSFIERNKFGGPIMEEILTASESPTRIFPTGPGDPSLAEGPLWIDLALSTFTGGGADLSGAPTNWPMSIAEIASLLTNTGELDIVLTPVIGSLANYDPLGNNVYFMNMATLETFTGNYGVDRTASVHFDYATGDFNVRLLRRSENMDTIANKLYYYLGQRLDQQHWRSNVTGFHPDLPPSAFTINLLNDIDLSRAELGVFMQQNIYDNFGSGSGDSTANPDETSAYPLFIRQWMIESLLRVRPRNMVYITPVRSGTAIPGGGTAFGPGDFDIGDLVTVNIGDAARVSESGAQRIYQYTIDIDDDAVEALGEFVTSPDQDSI